MKIDWTNQPYNHKTWPKDQKSIMNPNARVTWPQFIAEMVVWNRTRIINEYKQIKMGEGWSNAISDKVRKLVQQAYAICNYFPHPNEEPLVYVAFKNFFRNNRVLKIGQFRKGRKSITQDEKDVVKGVMVELDKLLKQRNVFAESTEKIIQEDPSKEKTFRTEQTTAKPKNSLSALLELERKLASKKE